MKYQKCKKTTQISYPHICLCHWLLNFLHPILQNIHSIHNNISSFTHTISSIFLRSLHSSFYSPWLPLLVLLSPFHLQTPLLFLLDHPSFLKKESLLPRYISYFHVHVTWVVLIYVSLDGFCLIYTILNLRV